MKVCPICGTEYGDDAAFCSRDRSPLQPDRAGTAQGLVGQMVAERYRVERRIGEGGMGEVYLATHVLMDRRCALKVMSPALSRDADAVTRFNREATNASRISHPNVCTIYDFGLTAEGLVYLAMEYIEGKTLTAVVEESGPMPVRRAAGLVAQCAKGLAAAHQLGIVHRDLKPDNIMVLAGKDGETVKLVDFGIAKAIEGDQAQRVTKTGFVIGTPEYMAPEQLSGDTLDARADQYALALVFYRLITGRLPFEASSVQETLVQRLTSLPQPLAAAHPGATFPAGLQSIMDTALARTPEERYATVEAFAQAVSDVSSSEAVPTRKIDRVIPATRPTPLPAPSRRSRMVLAATAAVIVGGGTWGVLQLTGSPADGGDTPVGDRIGRSNTPAPGPQAPPGPATPAPVPVAAPGPPPAPVPTTAVSSLGDTATDDSLSLPEPEDFDKPALRMRALARSRLILESERQPPKRRAEAAALLGNASLYRNDRAAALRFYSRAYLLFPRDDYRAMIQKLRDSVPQ